LFSFSGDIFTSLVKVLQDLAWTVCFIVSGDWMISEDLTAAGQHRWSGAVWYAGYLIPLLTLLPLVFRFNQCLRRYADTGKRFPHIANACKYAMSQTVTLFGAFHPLYLNKRRRDSDIFQGFWTFAFVASSLYSFYWDVFQDWGLGQRKYRFLAQRLMYPSRSFYYVIIAIDLVLRFAWVLTLLPPKSGAKFALPAYLTLVSMLFEIFRRTLWGFLRLENEHRTNTAGFRRVDFVPLHFSTGHNHAYSKQGEAQRGSTVLVEITVITLAVAAAGIVSVVAAQHATQQLEQLKTEL
jgi:xenotropic and polytropic retrovirus receptor 1